MIKLALVVHDLVLHGHVRLSSRASSPSSTDLSSWVFPDRADTILTASVADPRCLSRFRILIFTHPVSRIQKQEEKRGVKKN